MDMKIKVALLFLLALFAQACGLLEKISPNDKLGGNQSPQGELGNTYSVGGVAGVSINEVKVSQLADGVSTFKIKAGLTDTKYKSLVQALPYTNTSNSNLVEMEIKGRITDEGIQTVFPDGDLTLVKYNGKVGDTYTAKINGKSISREITYISKTDDYPYAFFDIKVMKVEETGFGLPGVSKIEYAANHKFGLVGIKIYFEDGSTKNFYAISSK
jgi:hypothetical protein